MQIDEYLEREGILSVSQCLKLSTVRTVAAEERRRFAQMTHEYLIDQLQFTGFESLQLDQVSQKIRLNYNHPVKEIIWTLQWEPNFTVGTAYNDWLKVSQ